MAASNPSPSPTHEKPNSKTSSDPNLSDPDPDPTSTGATTTIKALFTLLGTFLTVFVIFGLLNSYGAFQSWYETNQLRQHTPAAISWIGSLQLCMFFLSGLVVGRVCDTYGPRPPLIVGGVLYSFSLMMISISKQYYQFLLAHGLLNGFAIGVSFYPCLTSISLQFDKYRATAMGITLAGGGVGGLVFPIILSRLFNSIGFGWTVRILGFIPIVSLTISLLTISPYVPDDQSESNPWINPNSLSDKTFMMLTFAIAMAVMGFYLPSTYIVQYAQDQGLNQHLAFESLSVMNGLALVGETLIPLLADVFGKFNVLSVICLLGGVACLAIWLHATTSAAVLGFAALFGITFGAVPAVVPACVAQISEPCETGARIGLLYAFLAIPSLVGPPIGGSILERQHGSYSGMVIFAGVFLLFGGMLSFWSKLLVHRGAFVKV